MATTIPDVLCHLDMLPEPERAIEAALAGGVSPILTVGSDQASSERALELGQRFPRHVLVAVGLHPSEIPGLDAAECRAELAFVERTLPEADALGEVGLDFRDAPDETQRERQRQALQQQLEWAARQRKPVNLHCRRAEREILAAASAFAARTGLGVNLHWFTHSEKLARLCAEQGLFISPGPSILHSEAQAAVARAVAPDWLLLETDSPVEYAGEAAQPLWARQVATHLAALRGLSLEELAVTLQANLRRYLGRPQQGDSQPAGRP